MSSMCNSISVGVTIPEGYIKGEDSETIDGETYTWETIKIDNETGKITNGTENISSWRIVKNATDLNNMRNNLEANYILVNNITLTDNWTPIGTDYDNAFVGVFDGNGYYIRGLSIQSTTHAGFFGYVGNEKNATIKNVSLLDVNVNGASNNGTGTLIGVGEGVTIKNVMVTGNISSTGCCVGGLVGNVYGASSSFIENNHVSVHVIG